MYAHAGMVGLDGHKMSKSRGNLVLVSRLRAAGVDPTAIRLAILAHHYRDDWDWTDAGLAEAQDRLARWRRATSASRARTPPACCRPSAGGWPTTSTHRARSRRSTRGPGGGAGRRRRRPSVDGAPALVRDTVDALLGVAL